MKPVQGKALSKHAPQTGNSWSVFTSPTRCNEETSVPVRSMFDTESPESVRQHDRMSACLVNNSAESLSGESSLTLIISCHYIYVQQYVNTDVVVVVLVVVLFGK